MGNHRRVGLEFGEKRRERGEWRSASSRLVGRPLVRRAPAKAQSENWPSKVGWPDWKAGQIHWGSKVRNKTEPSLGLWKMGLWWGKNSGTPMPLCIGHRFLSLETRKIKATYRCVHADAYPKQQTGPHLQPVSLTAHFTYSHFIQTLLRKQVQFEITGSELLPQHPREEVLLFMTNWCLSATSCQRNQGFYLPSPAPILALPFLASQ